MKPNQPRPDLGRGRLQQFLEAEVHPRLTAERVFSHVAHEWRRVSERDLVGGCPWHKSSSGTSFKVRREHLAWYCHSCKIGGGPVQYLARVAGIMNAVRGADYVRFARELAEIAGVSFPGDLFSAEDQQHFNDIEDRRALLETCAAEWQMNLWGGAGADAQRYLTEGRGFTKEQTLDLQLGLYVDTAMLRAALVTKGHDTLFASRCGVLSDRWRNYITIPWRDEHGILLTISGRFSAISPPDGLPKITGLPGEHSKRAPIFLDRALRVGERNLVLVEGIFDAAMAQVSGDARCISCASNQLSADQLETLVRAKIQSITVSLDPDGGGDTGTIACIRQLEKVGISVRVAPRLPERIDPDDYIRQNGIAAWRAHLEQAIDADAYRVNLLVQRHRGDGAWTDAARESFLKEATKDELTAGAGRVLVDEFVVTAQVKPDDAVGIALNSKPIMRAFALLRIHDRAGFESALATLHRQGTKKTQIESLRVSVTPIATAIEQEVSHQSSDADGGSTATELIALVEGDGVELFQDAHGESYASRNVDGHVETRRLRERAFVGWLRSEYFRRTRNAPSTTAVNDALGVLEGKALASAQESVFVRIGGKNGNIYFDLGSPTWEIVEIAPTGWQLLPAAPIRFRRPPGMLSLPRPVTGGDVRELRKVVNCRDEDWPLLLGWLIAAFRDRGPYPALVLLGEQGAAKSSTGRAARGLVDPNSAPSRSPPRNERDLTIAAKNSWILFFDNLSRIEPWLSDALCRLATGGGYSTRALYTNDDEAIFDSQRPIILTGIEDVVERPDLLDRALVLYLLTILEKQRRTEAEIAMVLVEIAPRVLGALLDAVVVGLREIHRTHLDELPRMADFATWVTACEPALGLKPGEFLRAYAKNREEVVELALEASPVALQVRRLAEELAEPFVGTASELQTRLESYLPSRPPEGWPKSAKGVAGALRRATPALRAIGIETSFFREPGGTRRRLIRVAKSVPDAPKQSTPESDTVNAGADGTIDGTQGSSDRPAPIAPDPQGNEGVRDARDDGDDRPGTSDSDPRGDVTDRADEIGEL